MERRLWLIILLMSGISSALCPDPMPEGMLFCDDSEKGESPKDMGWIYEDDATPSNSYSDEITAISGTRVRKADRGLGDSGTLASRGWLDFDAINLTLGPGKGFYLRFSVYIPSVSGQEFEGKLLRFYGTRSGGYAAHAEFWSGSGTVGAPYLHAGNIYTNPGYCAGPEQFSSAPGTHFSYDAWTTFEIWARVDSAPSADDGEMALWQDRTGELSFATAKYHTTAMDLVGEGSCEVYWYNLRLPDGTDRDHCEVQYFDDVEVWDRLPGSSCGDGSCGTGETCISCPGDCLKSGEVCCSGTAFTGDCCTSSDCLVGACDNHQCTVCIPSCGECGSDGCSGSCGTCQSQYACHSGLCCHKSDTDLDGCVEDTELISFISRWKASSIDATMMELLEAVKTWKEGCG